MANLFIALDYLLNTGPLDKDPHNTEGGYSNVSGDHGGKTKYGVTQVTLNRYHHCNPGSDVPDTVERLTIKDVEKVYRWGYWRFDAVISQPIATKVFDMAVNFGLDTVTEMVQKICGVKVDGSFGPKTTYSVNAMDPSKLMSHLVDASVARYLAILRRDPSQEKFRKGWLSRAKQTPSI